MKRWICPLCGYEMESATKPKICPVCGYEGMVEIGSDKSSDKDDKKKKKK